MSSFFLPSSLGKRGGYLWPVALLLALSLVLAYAITMLIIEANKPVGTQPDLLAALSGHSEKLAEGTLPSLVRVTVRKFDSARASDELAVLFGDALTLPREDLGSGMFVNDTGLVLTNYHVVRSAEAIEVVDNQGRRQSATLVGFDALTDLALVQTAFKQTQAIRWGDAQELKSGTLVWAFGSPFGLENSVTMGIVSANRNSAISTSPFQDFVQTDVATNPGSSGGPLVNLDSQVVGINTAIAGDKFQGVSFALPASIARRVTEELATHGTIERGWVGVELSPVDSDRARRAGLPNIQGVYINGVVNSNTDNASALTAGDICLEIEGKSVNDPVVFSRTIANQRVGRQIKLLIQRDGEPTTVTVRILARPKES